MTETLKVDLRKIRDNSYSIEIGEKIIKKLPTDKNIFYIIDKNVFNLHHKLMPDANFLLFEASEHNKNFKETEKILSFLKEKKAIRTSTITAVGGGITGDISAFAASIYMRGIKCKQIPTTLLSMVDSSVGGKCGINFAGTKNFIGSFWQPSSVTIDINFLNTLSEEEYYSGLAEIIKMAVIFDEKLVNYIYKNSGLIKQKNYDILAKLIYRSCEIKADVVMKDEKEQGMRKLLNFGHTFGHAIETDSNHKIKHGLAVAKGMYLETLFASEKGFIDKTIPEKVKNLLKLFDYDINYQIQDKDLFFNSLSEDKKVLSSGIVLSLTDRLGSGKIVEAVNINEIVSFFKNN